MAIFSLVFASKKAAQKSSNAPVFIYAAFQAVHGPLTTDPRDEKIYEEFFERRRNETIYKRTKMLAMVTGLDRAVGRIVETFKKFGKYENTIFAFASDNGGSLTYRANNMPYRKGMKLAREIKWSIWGHPETTKIILFGGLGQYF